MGVSLLFFGVNLMLNSIHAGLQSRYVRAWLTRVCCIHECLTNASMNNVTNHVWKIICRCNGQCFVTGLSLIYQLSIAWNEWVWTLLCWLVAKKERFFYFAVTQRPFGINCSDTCPRSQSSNMFACQWPMLLINNQIRRRRFLGSGGVVTS